MYSNRIDVLKEHRFGVYAYHPVGLNRTTVYMNIEN